MLRAILAAILLGILSFLIGERLPRRWFSPTAWPFRCRDWERDGRIYEQLGVRAWKDLLPDMSKIIPGMVKKKAKLATTPEAMNALIQEVCVAETVHWALILLASPLIGQVAGGWIGLLCAVLYAAGNLPFVIIQRYNRPRLMRLLIRMKERKQRCC